MDIKRKVFISMFLLVFIIGFFYFFTDWFSKTTGFSINEDEASKLAGCLTGKNASLFGFEGCISCEKQKEIFRSSVKMIEYVKCPDSRCLGIESFPAWKINERIYYGVKSLDELKNLSGC